MTPRLSVLVRLSERPMLRSLALAVLVGATVLLLWRSDEPPLDQSASEQLRGPAEPDGFVIDGQYTAYDEHGNLKVRFASTRIEQFDEGNLATIEAPRAALHSAESTDPWLLEAEQGSFLQNESLLYLTGNVRVTRQVGDRQATLTTSELTLDNDQQTVFTEAPVEITDSLGVTRARGMKAWINERILELKSDVEGHYETVR